MSNAVPGDPHRPANATVSTKRHCAFRSGARTHGVPMMNLFATRADDDPRGAWRGILLALVLVTGPVAGPSATAAQEASSGGRRRTGADHRPAAEPQRIQQHGSRSAGRDLPAGGRFSAGRFELRVRHHRRRAVAAAAADGEVHDGRGEDRARRPARSRSSEADVDPLLPVSLSSGRNIRFSARRATRSPTTTCPA